MTRSVGAPKRMARRVLERREVVPFVVEVGGGGGGVWANALCSTRG